jgi:hypothetical protein
VDDLAVAAEFAQITSFEPKPKPSPPDDSNCVTISAGSVVGTGRGRLEASDSGSEAGVDEEADVIDAREVIVDGSGSDNDEESDIDLGEALARMNNESDDEDLRGKGGSTSNDRAGPRTENEVDAYKTPIDQLQSNFQLNLTVEEGERLRLAGASEENNGSVRLCAAGRIVCHMVGDRTIVVESEPGKEPLDEGTLLVLRSEPTEEEEKPSLFPLGKVFEVFGPIRRPLYTVRLPPPPPHPAKVSSFQRGYVVNDADEISSKDDNEIPLCDDDSQNKQENNQSEHDESFADDWGLAGSFTSVLAKSQRQTVFYIQDEAKLLDTFAIMKHSGKGCDASNLYDEEVSNFNEVYFSDDEEERHFKNRLKRGKKSKDSKQGQTGPTNKSHERSLHQTMRKPLIPGFHPNPYVWHSEGAPPLTQPQTYQLQPASFPQVDRSSLPTYPYLHGYSSGYPGISPNTAYLYQHHVLHQPHASGQDRPDVPQYPNYPWTRQEGNPNQESDTVYYNAS